jgi:hypothetical protein
MQSLEECHLCLFFGLKVTRVLSVDRIFSPASKRSSFPKMEPQRLRYSAWEELGRPNLLSNLPIKHERSTKTAQSSGSQQPTRRPFSKPTHEAARQQRSQTDQPTVQGGSVPYVRYQYRALQRASWRSKGIIPYSCTEPYKSMENRLNCLFRL